MLSTRGSDFFPMRLVEPRRLFSGDASGKVPRSLISSIFRSRGDTGPAGSGHASQATSHVAGESVVRAEITPDSMHIERTGALSDRPNLFVDIAPPANAHVPRLTGGLDRVLFKYHGASPATPRNALALGCTC